MVDTTHEEILKLYICYGNIRGISDLHGKAVNGMAVFRAVAEKADRSPIMAVHIEFQLNSANINIIAADGKGRDFLPTNATRKCFNRR